MKLGLISDIHAHRHDQREDVDALIDHTQGNTWSKHLEALIEANASRILAIVHGHRHVRYDPVRIDGMLFAAHPFGYPHQHSGVEDGYREISIGH